jgi:hypothetical protein
MIEKIGNLRTRVVRLVHGVERFVVKHVIANPRVPTMPGAKAAHRQLPRQD